MKKTIDQRLDSMIDEIRNGGIELIPCPDQIEISDPIEFQKGVNVLRSMNGLPAEKVDFGNAKDAESKLSKTTPARATKFPKVKKARRRAS